MSNKDNNLVIFEYTTFKKMICNWVEKVKEELSDCICILGKESESTHIGSHFMDWVSTMNGYLLKYESERDLPQLLEAIAQGSHRYDSAIDAFEAVSKDLAERSGDIAFLIQLLRDEQMRLTESLEERYKDMVKIDQEWNWFQSIVLDEDPKQVDVNPEQGLGNLQKMFGKELDYIAKNQDTDSIFEDVERIGDRLIADIGKKLEPILDSKPIDDVRESLNQDIKKFVGDSQANISEQMTTTFESLQRIFNDKLVPEIKAELARVSIPLRLSDRIERHLSSFATEIDYWKDQIDRFLEKVQQFREDVEPSCESFRRDFECQDLLKKCQHNLKTDELEDLQCLFGLNGTGVFTRVRFESENLKKVQEHAWDNIHETYDLKTRRKTPGDLGSIFEHAYNRFEHIYADLEEKLDD